MDDQERMAKMLDNVRNRSQYARYVLGRANDEGYVYGYAGMGETFGRRLAPAELTLLHQLLADGLCVVGSEQNFVTADLQEKGLDPDTGLMYHKDLHIVGRLIEPQT